MALCHYSIAVKWHRATNIANYERIATYYLDILEVIMFGLSYFKAKPNQYVMQHRRGKVVREGAGLSFFFYRTINTIVSVPLETQDVNFIFKETTADFQVVTVQGTFTFKVIAPEILAKSLDYSLKQDGISYESDDPKNLPNRIVNSLQVILRSRIQKLGLKETLEMSVEKAVEFKHELKATDYLIELGIEVIDLSITAIKPTAETEKALEANIREKLMGEMDDAIYERRNAAIEAERVIQENELDTEHAIEQKKREIMEAQLDAEQAQQKRRQQMAKEQLDSDIILENEKEKLVEIKAKNDQVEADAKGYTLAKTIEPLESIDSRIIQALAATRMDPAQLIAQSFGDIALNAEKIGELNIAPDLLRELITNRTVQ